MAARRRTLLGLLAALTAGGRCARAADAGFAPLRIVTGDLPPFAIEGQPARRGVLVDLVELLFKRCGQATSVEYFPWNRALSVASNLPRVAILPLTRTPERERSFQWLVKLYVQHFVFINQAGQAPITSVERAREVRIALLRGSPNLAQLLRHGFDERRILLASSVDEMLRLLERGLVDALYGGDVVNMDKVRSSGRDPAAFQIGMTLESGDVWLAASSGFSDAEKAALNEAHAALFREGLVEQLFRSYGIRARAEDLR
jgi:polar amino acid transport system substrate-binding protein